MVSVKEIYNGYRQPLTLGGQTSLLVVLMAGHIYRGDHNCNKRGIGYSLS